MSLRRWSQGLRGGAWMGNNGYKLKHHEMFRLDVKRNIFPLRKVCQVTQGGQAGVECFKTRLGKPLSNLA